MRSYLSAFALLVRVVLGLALLGVSLLSSSEYHYCYLLVGLLFLDGSYENGGCGDLKTLFWSESNRLFSRTIDLHEHNAVAGSRLPTYGGRAVAGAGETHMEMLPFVLTVAFVAAFVALLLWWHFGRSNSLLQQWAERNGYRVIEQEYRNFLKGPFFWTSSRGRPSTA